MEKTSLLVKYDLTVNEICTKIEDGLINYLQTISKNGNRPFILDDKIGWIKTFPTAWSNYIFYSNFDTNEIDYQISQVISKIKAGEIPDVWVVGPKSNPKNISNYLEMNEFTKQYELIGMALDIVEMDTTVVIPEDVNIIAVDNKQALALWADVISKGLWNGNTFEVSLFENLLHNPEYKFYLAFLNGEPVASSMIQLSDGIAAIDLVATLREHWGKGIGTAMTKIPLLYSRDNGFKIGILQSSKAGERCYRKIGFEEYCRFPVYKYQQISG